MGQCRRAVARWFELGGAGMDIRGRYAALLIAIAVSMFATGPANADDRVAAPPSLAQAAQADAIPHDVPKTAAAAMKLALKWHADAQMIDLSIKASNNYAIEFTFASPT